jgi:hypothetical protein
MYRDDRAETAAFLRGHPGLLEAIEQRVIDLPEYGKWLQHYGHDVLVELERHRISAPAHEPASSD